MFIKCYFPCMSHFYATQFSPLAPVEAHKGFNAGFILLYSYVN